MEEERKKKLSETNKLKPKKKNILEMKAVSEPSKSTLPNRSLENIVVIGKGLSQCKSIESGIQLHVCDALPVIPFPGCNESLKEKNLSEEVKHVSSNISFLSAQSDLCEVQSNKAENLEYIQTSENVIISKLKPGTEKGDHPKHSSVTTETDESLQNMNLQLKEMEKILSLKEKKIKYLQNKIEECSIAKSKQVEENRGLTHQIGLLNRQLQSMYELLGKKDWESPVDPAEFANCKSKIFELETVIAAQDEDHKELTKRIQIISENLDVKEKELVAKNKELIDYKNRSTLEVCKLINQIDNLQKEAKIQTELLESKVQEAQKVMDDEIVKITQKLEDQYQRDLKNAIEKLQADFEKLSDMPNTAIEKLLKYCEPEKVDLITIQKDWDRQQTLLESKIQAMQSEHKKELFQVKDSYEGRILLLKAQVESLTSQLNERKEILDVFENELTMYKSKSSMNLLKASTIGDDMPSLKELYMTEIFSQKQIHKLQLGIFEEKVKTLSEEILYHARNEELHLQELENAKKMSLVFREKYEQLVTEWEERVEKEFEIPDEMILAPEKDVMFEEFKSVIERLKKSEDIYEERLKLFESRTDDERLAYLKEIKSLRVKFDKLQKFQETQIVLDESIQELIKALGTNYTKTVDALTTSHLTELSLKDLEICSLEKRHAEETNALRYQHEKEIEEFRLKIEKLESSTQFTESESNLKKTQEDEMLKQKLEKLSLESLKYQGIIAMKEEIEHTLNDRIRELGDALKAKEESCKKELEDLTAKFIEAQVLFSAKDELAKELESKLNESEKMLEESCKEIDRLQSMITHMEKTLKIEKNYPNDGGDFSASVEISEKFEKAKVNGEQLKMKILEVFDRVEHLEGLSRSSGDANESLQERHGVLERERSIGVVLDENRKLKFENSNLVDEITKMQKTIMEMELKNNLLMEKHEDIKKKLEAAETEKIKLFLKEKAGEKDKEEMQQRNDLLEENVQDLTIKMDNLLSELSNHKGSQGEVFSISLQEVRVLYHEEQETGLETGASTSTFDCQTDIDMQQDTSIISLLKTNQNLKKENACLKMELRNRSKKSFYEDMICKFRNIQKELLIVLNERDGLLTDNEKLRQERNYFKEEMENLRDGLFIREVKKPEITCGETQEKLPEMKEEIEKLTEYIRFLSAKVDIMKANNDILLSSSQEHLKRNQNLVNELEEAWSQRYEIEEQLAKVRKENAILNEHLNHLEETNRRISSLIAEGKPSVVSWIKIHETVENIVDEVLALKTSFSSSSLSRASTGVETPRTTSELKMMTETLHIQLKNKMMLCDELIIQKETLEKELKSLESLIKENPKSPRMSFGDQRNFTGKQLDSQNINQLKSSPLEKCQVLEWNLDCFNPDRMIKTSENSHLITLNRLKKHLEEQVEWEEARFRENLELEIKGLRMQMLKEEERLNSVVVPSKKNQEFLEMKYQQEAVEIGLEFLREVNKLKKLFDCEKKDNCRERYAGEIDRLKNYLEKRWDYLRNRFCNIYNNETMQLKLHIGEKTKNNNLEELVGNRNKCEMEKIRVEYEKVLEEERKKFNSVLEETKQIHNQEIIDLEDFWTEKLSECETKCAIIKATRSGKDKHTEYQKNSENISKREQVYSEEEKKTEEHIREVEKFDSSYPPELEALEEKQQGRFCAFCSTSQSYLNIMEIKTDDDKLEIILQRDSLKEMVLSMKVIISNLLAFIGYQKKDLSNDFNLDDTVYKSIQIKPDPIADVSTFNARQSLDLSTLIQDLSENSFHNSSDHIRFELEKSLKQLKKDAENILALSVSDNFGLSDIVKKLEKEQEKLEAEVLKVEKMQKEIKKEVALTKERLNQWERNLEVVAEGYGEEVIKPKQMITLSDLKDKLKLFLADCVLPLEEVNLLEEICNESERLQEQWKHEKHDLEQQIDVADKQVQSLKKFLEEQATEREQEREAFDKEVNQLKENLKLKERDSFFQNKTNKELEALEGELKELSYRLTETQKNKSAIEGEFQNAIKKIWSLREVIQDLETQLADTSEKECSLKKKVVKLESLIEDQNKINRHLKEELETCRNQNDIHYLNHIKTLEEELNQLRSLVDQVDPKTLTQLNANLRHIESILIKKTKDLEQLHVSSANVSCSSPSEDVSIRDHFDATRCSTPDEMSSVPQSITMLPFEEIERVHEKLSRHTRAEEVTIKYVQDLKMQLRNVRKTFEEVQTERDILLEKVDLYLKENSGLKVRLEEQRCNAGFLQKQLNANLETQISRLEMDVEKLKNLCDEKDKQLCDLKTILENTTKSLKKRETEALNKTKEENSLITTIRTDLANTISENVKLEKKLEKMRKKLKESMTMPALLDSMLDEKNAEIDRLEKEVLRLSSEKTSGVSSTSYSTDRKKKGIKFSEPDSFSENISSISPQGSDLRNCSDSFEDFRNYSVKVKRPIICSTKVESISSIAPLQLSPRGASSPGMFSWKTSSPVVYVSPEGKNPKTLSKSSSQLDDFQQMQQISKLKWEIESKHREISELNLETDKLKRQLVEINQELIVAKTQTKEVQNDLTTREEDIRKLKNNEKSLLMTIESLKENHAEEISDFHNKLSFEREKVEKVYEEIKALEVKKVEIEESFLSLKEDYNEKMITERKTAEILMERIKALQFINEDSEMKLTILEKDLEAAIKNSEITIQKLSEEIFELKNENEKMRLQNKSKIDAQTQIEFCQEDIIVEIPTFQGSSYEDIEQLKLEFEKITAVIGEKNFHRTEAFAYVMAVKKIITALLKKLSELSQELDMQKKKLMESSVDELALKVQKELILSATLDKKLLLNIEANAGKSNILDEFGGGDNLHMHPFLEAEIIKFYKELTKRMSDSEKEKEHLKNKLLEQQKIICLLEERLKNEKERMLGEKERCTEDAKIMELLRVNLEKGLRDIKAKEKELKKEKQQKLALEKEVEILKKNGLKEGESKKRMELNAQLESLKEKMISIDKLLEEEKTKNQELILSLEQSRIERIIEKKAYELIKSELNAVKEQKENFKKELMSAKNMLNSRNAEIRCLQQKVNLQGIDIKALSLSNSIHGKSASETSFFVNRATELDDLTFNSKEPSSTLNKMRNVSLCVQRKMKENAEIGETLLYLNQETEQVKDLFKKLEQGEPKLPYETFECDSDIEKKLWALEKGGLILDLENLRGENEILKRDLEETCKSIELLKIENSELKKEKSKINNGPFEVANEFLQDRVSHLTWKYLRTESYRKALAWQKNFLIITLKDYQILEEKAWKKMARMKKGKRSKRNGRFKAIALVLVSIFRMKFIVKKWRKNAFSDVCTLLEKNNFNHNVISPILSISGEPCNPLSYQVQNIFLEPSSRELKTPPCRDPGPRSYSVDSKKKPDCFGTFPYFQGSLSTARVLP